MVQDLAPTSPEETAQLVDLVSRVDAGDLQIAAARRRPLTDLAAVHDEAAAGRLAGKTELTPDLRDPGLGNRRTGRRGLLWVSRRNLPERALMLFGNRCGPDLLEPCPHLTLDLDRRDGVERANSLLRPFYAAIVPAARLT